MFRLGHSDLNLDSEDKKQTNIQWSHPSSSNNKSYKNKSALSQLALQGGSNLRPSK